MNNLERLINTCVSLGTAQTLETLGMTSGEISGRKARSVYGKYFTDQVERGRLLPSRCDQKTKWYKVTDILKLKAYDSARAELKL